MVRKDRKLNRKWLAPAAMVLGLSMPLVANAGNQIDGWDVVVGATLAIAFHDSYYDRHYPARYHSGYRFAHRDWYGQHRPWRHHNVHRFSHGRHRVSRRHDRHHDRHDRRDRRDHGNDRGRDHSRGDRRH